MFEKINVYNENLQEIFYFIPMALKRSLGFLSGAGPPLSFASISLARTDISSSILYRGELST